MRYTFSRGLGLLVLISSALSSAGQTINGSAYSYYGVGTLQGRVSAYNRAMGYTGIGLRDDYNLSAVNPASFNALTKPFTTLVELGATYESVSHATGTSKSPTKSGGLTGLNFLFKLSSKWGVSVGASPLSSVTYKATSPRQFGSSVPSLIAYEGSGGINQFSFGNAYEIFKNFSLGANVSYYQGTITRGQSLGATTVTDPLHVSNTTYVHNAGYDAGFQYTVPIKRSKLTVGATFDPGVHLSGTQKLYITNSNLDTLKKTDKLPITYRLPPSYGAGIGFRSPRSTFAADIHWLDWKHAIMNDGQPYQNSYKYSVGYEHRGDLTSLKYLSAITFRAGAYYQDYPLVLKNTPFPMWGYTFGLSLPLDGYRASININYAFTQLGTTDASLVKESSNRLVLDFIIRDIWGVKRKLD